MYAIVKTGGQQFKVQDGDVITVNKIEGDAGAKVEIKEVLMTGGDNSAVGSPFVVGALVEAEIVRQKKAKKINGFNYKAKKNVRKRWGHRAQLTELKITKISAGK
ncbi:MAG: 50S ribosomal protein L21 [Armatimonadetes bacterium]|nr:50S ribosomal protein L21 [Armatimonadota bacterium]